MIAAILGLAISVGAIFGAVDKQQNPINLVWIYAAAWFVVGIVVTLVVRGRAPASEVVEEFTT